MITMQKVSQADEPSVRKPSGRGSPDPTSSVERFHGDERGAISIVSVFALLLLTMLLGMVMNSARQVDHKIRLQNAADTTSWTGGLVMARNMNTLAFTNHLLSDVFALTAFLREAQENHAAETAPELLDNWERIGPFLQTSEFPPFADLGNAISAKVPIERRMATTWTSWARSSSDAIRPVLEQILAQELIPQFQRTLVKGTPMLVHQAMSEVAGRHGRSWPSRTQLHSAMWHTTGEQLGQQMLNTNALPVVDPMENGSDSSSRYFRAARSERDYLAHVYLQHWNHEKLREWDGAVGDVGQNGKMSQYANVWRIFTCGQLRRLLEEEYPDRNMPYQIRCSCDSVGLSYQTRRQDENLELNPKPIPVNQPDIDAYLETQFMFVGVVYAPPWPQMMAGLFKNPTSNDAQAYTQIALMVPRRRIVREWWRVNERQEPYRQNGSVHPTHWDLTCQNWSVQMTAATAPGIPTILSSTAANSPGGSRPNLSALDARDLHWISSH